MKHLKTFEAYTNVVPKAVGIEQKLTLMDKSVDKELTEEEKEELEEDIEQELKKKPTPTK
jgi:hypothetical protein